MQTAITFLVLLMVLCFTGLESCFTRFNAPALSVWWERKHTLTSLSDPRLQDQSEGSGQWAVLDYIFWLSLHITSMHVAVSYMRKIWNIELNSLELLQTLVYLFASASSPPSEVVHTTSLWIHSMDKAIHSLCSFAPILPLLQKNSRKVLWTTQRVHSISYRNTPLPLGLIRKAQL